MDLGPKEGLALINGTQMITALGALGILEIQFTFRSLSYNFY